MPGSGGRGLLDPVAEGASVFLRRPDAADEEELLAVVTASQALHAAWIKPPRSPDEFAAYLVRSSKTANAAFLVCTVPDGAIAGVFNLSEISPTLRTAWCSYYAASGYEGRGLMSQGLELLLGHAFGAMGLTVFGASIQPGNEASIRFVERAGFRREKAPPRYLRLFGVWRGHPTWSISRQRWVQLREDRGEE
jgi:ribosomal-protein-alanine N-acetyltransferase